MPKEYPNDKSGGLFDYLKVKMKLHRDRELAEIFDTTVSVISEIRNGNREVNDSLLVRICTNTGISLKKAQTLIAYKDGPK